MLSVSAPSRASCGCVVEATKRRAMLEANVPVVVVPKFRPPAKIESDVVVERRLPTVSCDVVEISAVPAELTVTIVFGEKDEEPVPPLEKPRVPVVVMVGETEPTTVKAEQVRNPEQVADDVATLFTNPLVPV